MPKEFNGEWRACKRCLTQYKLSIPYQKANSPARNLCDNCIVDLSKDEFMAYDLEEGPALTSPQKGSSGNEGGSLADYI